MTTQQMAAEILDRMQQALENPMVAHFEKQTEEIQIAMFRAYSLLYKRDFLKQFYFWLRKEYPTAAELEYQITMWEAEELAQWQEYCKVAIPKQKLQ